MNDAYYELLVKKQQKSTDMIIRCLTIAAIVVLVLISPLFAFIPLILAIILGAAAYFFIFPRLSVEYEYALLNRELEIDAIYNKQKRKKMTQLDLASAELIAPATSHRLDSYKNLPTVDYSSGDPAKAYAIVIPIDQSTKQILIDPDQKIKELLSTSLPRTFFQD